MMSFLQGERLKKSVEKAELLQQFKTFYQNNRNRQDLLRNKSTKEVDAMSDEKWWKLIRDNPLHFLGKTHHELFGFEEEQFNIKLNFDWIAGDKQREKWFVNQVRDALEFRREEFLDQRIERKEVEGLRVEKCKELGGFKEKIFLLDVIE